MNNLLAFICDMTFIIIFRLVIELCFICYLEKYKKYDWVSFEVEHDVGVDDETQNKKMYSISLYE